jgi:DNA-binding winged helix-turn-helix (wHTH) protein
MKADQVRIGPFRLNLAQHQLSRDGVPVRLGSRALEILCVLASAKGQLVTKDELMAHVWPGVVVEENAIQVHVSALRKALGTTEDGSSYVITVPGRGYRLVASSENSAQGALAGIDQRGASPKNGRKHVCRLLSSSSRAGAGCRASR